MGLHSRGYRLADWFDIRPYNPSYTGLLRPEGVKPEHREAYDILVKSFAPIAVSDKEYDALGPFPKPPVLKAGEPVIRTLILYNYAFADEHVELRWDANLNGQTIDRETRRVRIPLGDHVTHQITLLPSSRGKLRLELATIKAGREQIRDTRLFRVE